MSADVVTSRDIKSSCSTQRKKEKRLLEITKKRHYKPPLPVEDKFVELFCSKKPQIGRFQPQVDKLIKEDHALLSKIKIFDEPPLYKDEFKQELNIIFDRKIQEKQRKQLNKRGSEWIDEETKLLFKQKLGSLSKVQIDKLQTKYGTTQDVAKKILMDMHGSSNPDEADQKIKLII